MTGLPAVVAALAVLLAALALARAWLPPRCGRRRGDADYEHDSDSDESDSGSRDGDKWAECRSRGKTYVPARGKCMRREHHERRAKRRGAKGVCRARGGRWDGRANGGEGACRYEDSSRDTAGGEVRARTSFRRNPDGTFSVTRS